MKTNIKLCLALALASTALNAQTLKATVAGSIVTNTTAGSNSTFVGTGAGNSTTAAANTFVGNTVGYSNTTGENNTFVGALSGYSNVSGSSNLFLGTSSGYANTASNNAFLGYMSGRFNTSGTANIFLGPHSGYSNTTGSYSTFIGFQAGYVNSTGDANVFIGHGTGMTNTNGWGNTYMGFGAGRLATGSLNVFLGNGAGTNETGSQKLYIDNSAIANPLIWGDFTTGGRQLKFHSKVGIGLESGFGAFPTTAGTVNVSNYRLFVKGGILTEEVRVNLASGWADYVFSKDYDLKPLSEVDAFIKQNGHLPNVPSACEVESDGIELGNIAKIQQEKIEELTLYLIQQQKEIEVLKAQVKALVEKR